MRAKGSKSWSAEEENFVRENAGMMSYQAMADILGRSASAVQLFMYRRQIPLRRQLKRAIIPEMLRIKFGDASLFAANKAFYSRCKISCQRWNRLRFGYEQPSQEEIVNISRALNMDTREMVMMQEAMQLDLFDKDIY